jgi:hypothetical protein
MEYNHPYVDQSNLRIFDVNADDSQYVWHRDNEDRLIEIISGDGWRFQKENDLPWLLSKGMRFKINAQEYHRIIKGITDLKIRITPLINKTY